MTEGTVTTGGGCRLHYRMDGPPAGPVVVLAGSLGTTLEMWEPQAGRLSSLARVLRYDHRGHGGSSAPPGPYAIADLGQDLVDLLDALDVPRAAVCGLSLGGMVGMWVAAHHPDRAASLVLACTDAELGPPAPWLERAAAVRNRGTASLGPGLVERWFPASGRDPAVTTPVVAMLEGCDDDGYASCCEAIAGMDLRPDLAEVGCPVLVVGGSEDPVVPPKRAVALAAALRAGLLVLPGASHLANLSQPDRFT
ncbi:MAG: alpha/beta fold hydrolase, partial [Acidimicrobiales bacterium]